MFLSAICSVQPALAETSIKGWLLNQHCYMLGDETLYVTPEAIRVEWKSQGTVMLCQAPDFKLILFNPTSRRYYETADSNARKLMSQRISMIAGLESSPKDFQPAGKGQIAGVSATRLEPQSHARHGPFCKEFWIADQMRVLPRLADAYCHYISAPAIGKLPLQLVNLDPDDHVNKFLVCKECRQLSIPASTFVVPKSYQRVASDTQIMVNDSDVGSIFDLEPEPKKNKKK